jgi:hypothetical protein
VPGPRDVALDHYTERQRLSEAAARVAAQAWGQVDPDDILRSWLGQLPELTTAVSGAQLRAAQDADSYTTDVLEAQGLDAAADAQVANRAFAGVASDGRSLATLLANPAITALSAIKDGVDVARALAAGHANLDMIVRTQVADAGRVADQAALVARPSATGYVRVAVGKTCNRCMILAGKRYRWNDGFLRHPRCDCIHLGCEIAEAAHLVQDPEELYARMSPAERTRAGFTAADQAAIRDGADLNAVVNAHRGMYTTTVGGRKIRATREGTTVRGVFGGFEIDPDTGALRRRAGSELERRRSGSRRISAAKAPRLTPEQIYRIAGDNRDEAVWLLRRNGYLINRRVVRAAPKPDPVAVYRTRAAAAATGDAALDAAPRSLLRGDGLTASQRSSLFQYKGTGYRGVNGALRRESGQLPDSWAFDFARDLARDIDAVMAQSALTRDVLVQRGIMRGPEIFGDRWNGSLVGAEWTEHAYLSTTAEATVSREFLQGADTARMKILVPDGTRGIELSKLDYEGEILLERGLRLRVVTDTGPGPDRVIELEVIRRGAA